MSRHGDRPHATSDSNLSGRFSRRGFLAAAGSGAAVTLAGCSGNGDGEGPIRIGGTYLLSGLAEALGAGSEAAAQVAVDAINEDGGIDGREIELEVRDHGDDPQAQVRSLVQEFEADVLLGMTSSGVTLNTGPTWEQLGVPITLTDIGTPWITEHDTETYGSYYEEDGTAAGIPNLFRTNSHTAHMTYAMAQFTVDNYPDITRIANMGPDYAYGEQTWEYYQAYLDGLGFDYEVVESQFPELGSGDMTPQITNVMNADPELVFTSFWASDTVTFTDQAAEAGLFDEVVDVLDTIGASPDNFEALGDTMPEGVHYSGWYWPGSYDTDADQAFVDRYQETYADDDSITEYPTFTGGSTWAAVQIYADAIEEAGGTNPDDLIDVMEGYTYDDDPRGSITLDSTHHQANASCVIGESSFDADVPYDGAGQVNIETYEIEREEALDLLEGSDLPPGM
ncbi:ABC transporter substrate-binding protein [Natronomonas sp. F2-12]|jgi:branched-chain amino acid transport system substrate-binding protein|uniref:ABC transporter substrate-binding protein n=1 Tax=Natronomonas aquatica TaxID=2841590 RepID=A0A9R1CQV8_9EURY|nr:ABC transporter substrate-binding protein [Natronomonas aquatica]MCQ4332034.1 ABC transporter substrate-binding protein [Natronomonas aquatica]